MTYSLLLLLAVGFWTEAAADGPVDERARALFIRAKGEFHRGEFPKALASFQRAQRLRPAPTIDLNIGRCLEKMGRKRRAVAHYRRYIAARPDAPNAEALRRRISRLSSHRSTVADPYLDLERAAPKASPQVAVDHDHGLAQEVPALDLSKKQASAPQDIRYQRRAPDRAAARRPLPRQRPPAPWEPQTPRAPTDESPLYRSWAFWTALGVVTVISVAVLVSFSTTSPRAQSHRQGLYGAGGYSSGFSF